MEIGTKYVKCETCKYFLQHYIKRDTVFHRICCGHCVNRQLNGKWVRKKYVLHENCEYWESNEEKIVERSGSIKNVLRNMEEHLNEISMILKDDRE